MRAIRRARSTLRRGSTQPCESAAAAGLDTAARGVPRAGLRRSAAPLALRLSGQLGAEPARASKSSRRRSPAAMTALSPIRCGAGRGLPRVRLFQAWNEPNLARYLEPQWVAEGGRWRAFSPLLYRQLLNGFYARVKSVEPTDTVVAAGVAPNGEPTGVGRMAPVRFLRGMLCLEGRARGSCSEPPHFDVLAFHPLSFGNPPICRRAPRWTSRSRTSRRSPACCGGPSAAHRAAGRAQSRCG